MLRNSLLILAALLWGAVSNAASTRTVAADQIQSADGTKIYQLPAQAGTSTVMVSAGLIQESPSGAVNGSNAAFSLSQTPASAASLQCYVDGLLQIQGGGQDYTLSGSTVTFVSAPVVGQTIFCVYTRY